MSSEAFLSLYLKEIGVQTLVSSFLSATEKEISTLEAVQEKMQTVTPATTYIPQGPPSAETPALEIAEPEPSVQATPASEVYVEAGDLLALQKQAEACKSCELVDSRNELVFGDGNPHTDLVFIGEAPGRDEDIAGKVFVGSSGALFNRMLISVGFDRDDVYVMHGVKCRPQHNRDPKPDEFAACERWLVTQLDMIKPKMICLLGRVVAQSLLKTDASLKELRENRHTFRGIPVLVIDHPSYLLRSQQHKRRAWADLCKLQNFIQTL